MSERLTNETNPFAPKEGEESYFKMTKEKVQEIYDMLNQDSASWKEKADNMLKNVIRTHNLLFLVTKTLKNPRWIDDDLIAEMLPRIDEKDALLQLIKLAENQVENGEVYTSEELKIEMKKMKEDSYKRKEKALNIIASGEISGKTEGEKLESFLNWHIKQKEKLK